MKRALALLLFARPASAEPCVWPDLCLDARVRDTLDAGWLARTGFADTSIVEDASLAIGAPSSLEQRWLVDGVPADGAGLGPGFSIPRAFFDHVDVTGAGVDASARVATAGAIDTQLRDHDNAANLWLRVGPSRRALPAVAGTYAPATLTRDPERGFDFDLVETHQFGHFWALGGVSTRAFSDDLTRTTQRLRDADGDGRYDTHPDGTFATDPIESHAISDLADLGDAILRVGGSSGRQSFVATGLLQVSHGARHAPLGTDDASLVKQSDLASLGIVEWKYATPSTELAITGSWHRDHFGESGDDRVQIGTAYVPAPADVPDDAALATACDGNNLCPVATGYYVRGGAGLLTSTIADTPSLTLALAHVFGAHHVQVGVGGEDARDVITRRFSGGRLERRLAETVVFQSRLVDMSGGPDSCGELGPCTFLAHATRTYRTRNLAAWANDTWYLTPDLQVDGGLRWESMEVGDALAFSDELAPRLSFAYDPTGRRRARIFAGFSRGFALLPLGYAVTVLGDSPIYTHLDSPIGTSDTLQSSRTDVSGAARAPHVDSLDVGTEWMIADRLDVGAAFTSSTLWDGIDDQGNPVAGDGRGGHELRVWLGNAPDAAVALRVAYVRTRARGNCDLPPFRCPSDHDGAGLLANDLPNRFFLEVAHGQAHGAWTFDAGARFAVSSGTPVDVLSADDVLLPRGAIGRMPTQSSITLHLGATRGHVVLGLDAIDLLDRRAAAAVDERWTLDSGIAPIDNGDAADLVWLRDDTGAPVRRNPGFGTPTRFASPVSVRLQIGATF